MDEDEEVDIVGGLDDLMSKNEREISSISSGQILSCEYTVHPLWLADANDGTELWPENLPKQSSQDEMEMVQDEVVIEEPAPIDINWCEEQEPEETSTCGDIILEQDIPASLEEEVVTNSGTECDDTSDCYSQSPVKHEPNRSETHIWTHNPASLLRQNFIEPKPLIKFKQKLMVNKKLLKLNQYNFSTNQSAGTSLLKPKYQKKSNKNEVTKLTSSNEASTKFKQSVTLLKRDIPVPESEKIKCVIKRYKKKSAQRTENSKKKKAKNCVGRPTTSGSNESMKTLVDLHGGHITINHDVENNGNMRNSSTRKQIESEIVKVENESDSDVEVDIESDTPSEFVDQKPVISPPPELQTIQENKKNIVVAMKIEEKPEIKTEPVIKLYDDELARDLETMEIPKEELKLTPNMVTPLEKYFHSEFFEGRPTKTPERYFKIRDFILNTWRENRPSYVSKTTVRNGLKHCGDVNCISRIHCLLEQIGAINFDHDGDQFAYTRPLTALKEQFTPTTRSKSNSISLSSATVILDSETIGRRQRIKSISSPSHSGKDVDANYTVSHITGIPTLVFASAPPPTPSHKEREHHRREASCKPLKIEFELIECLHFTKDQLPPFKVSITLSTLICLQLHALSSKFEVMGFLGGFTSKSVGRNKLSLTRYKPCNTSSQTTTTCEMCPVSQVEQVSNLSAEGYELLGWFHSHPTFEPNPSRTDVATQADMQHQFSFDGDRPFIGFILGCIDMRFNCMYILPKDLHGESNDMIPHRFDVDIIKDCSSLRHEIADVFNVLDRNSGTYYTSIEKFTRAANILLRDHGNDTNILEYIKDYL